MVSSAQPGLGQAPAADGAALEHITVTAQKREEKLERVPIAIGAVSGDQLARLPSVKSADLAHSATVSP
jgi:outer membrane receptor protein involved in Fe transport